ncbi:MAG: lipid-A-disaccharide synthase [Rikenellaceae bacterium]
MKYYFIVGEPSGDLHASKVINKIKKRDSSAKFRFWGGDKMCEMAGRSSLVKHLNETSIMGFKDVVMNIEKISKQLSICKQDILDFAPDVVVLVDYAGFNLKIAKFAKKHGFKVFYYIAPKVWAWRERRVKALKRYVDELFVIFPFEVDYFKSKGIEAHYFGNPLMDAIDKSVTNRSNRDQFFEENELDKQKPIVSLVAGSRRSEIRDNLPFMVKIANKFPQYQFVITAVGWLNEADYRRHLGNSNGNISIVFDKTYDTIKYSDAAIVTSGTATLETALLGTPEFVCFYTAPLTALIVSQLIKIKFVSLVNIILGREAIRELLRGEMTVDNAVKELKSIMKGGNKRQEVLSDYRLLREMMGEGEVSGKVAEKMIELVKK